MSNLQSLEQRMNRVDYQVISDDKDKRIADLEAKLAESEKEKQELKEFINNRENCNEWLTMKDNENLQYENKQLKQQLAQCEADRKFEQEKKDIAMKRVSELKQQLAEKEKEYQSFKKIADENVNYLKNRILEETRSYNQDKISFAVEKLVGVQKYISDNAVYIEEESFGREINDFIDNQIKQLKEMK